MKLTCQPIQLTITFEGFEQLWALKRRLQIPKHAIANITYMPQTPVMQDYQGHLRFPGTALRWYFLAGSYIRKNHREFWYVKMRQPGVLVIDMHADALNYDCVRLTCTPEIAQSVADWWQERP